MRHLILLLSAFGLLLAPTIAPAQSTEVEIGPNKKYGQISFPGSQYNYGVGGELRATLGEIRTSESTTPVLLSVRGDYHSFTTKQSGSSELFRGAVLGLIVPLEGEIGPSITLSHYMGLGGAYRKFFGKSKISGTKPAVVGVSGVELGLGPVSFYFEGELNASLSLSSTNLTTGVRIPLH